QQQRADVLAVHVGIGKDHDLAIPAIGDVLVFADVDTDSGNDAANLGVVEHLLDPSLLDVYRFAAEGENGLVHAVAAALGGLAGRVALDQKQLRLVAVAASAVHQLAGQAAGVKDALAIFERLLGLGGGLAGLGSQDHLFHDLLGILGVFLQILAQGFIDYRGDIPLDFRIIEANLGLSF